MKPTLSFFSILCLAAALIILGSNQPPSRNQTFTSKSTALNAPASELLEEDFVVAPGADPRAITMEIADERGRRRPFAQASDLPAGGG